MDGHAIYVHGHAKNDDFPIDFAIFTKALPTDQRTDGRTDIPSYRDAIAASKKHKCVLSYINSISAVELYFFASKYCEIMP